MVEGKVDVLEEEWKGAELVEELSSFVCFFGDLNPELLLFAVCALNFVFGALEAEILGPHAAVFILIGALQRNE